MIHLVHQKEGLCKRLQHLQKAPESENPFRHSIALDPRTFQLCEVRGSRPIDGMMCSSADPFTRSALSRWWHLFGWSFNRSASVLLCRQWCNKRISRQFDLLQSRPQTNSSWTPKGTPCSRITAQLNRQQQQQGCHLGFGQRRV